MTPAEFNQLSPQQQNTLAYVRGRYLATRWPAATEAVRLYLLPEGFFVESTFDLTRRAVTRLFAFGGGEDDPLDAYARLVQLPEWMPAVE